jgi:hypothetical protein
MGKAQEQKKTDKNKKYTKKLAAASLEYHSSVITRYNAKRQADAVPCGVAKLATHVPSDTRAEIAATHVPAIENLARLNARILLPTHSDRSVSGRKISSVSELFLGVMF